MFIMISDTIKRVGYFIKKDYEEERIMKKLLSLAMAGMLAFSVAACGNSETPAASDSNAAAESPDAAATDGAAASDDAA